MSLDVPGCKRRFASPDKGFAKQRPGLANCGGVRRGNGAKRNDLAERSPPTLRVEGRKAASCPQSGQARLQSC